MVNENANTAADFTTAFTDSNAGTALKAVLFDLDGVLVDTAKYHYLGWKRLADRLGIAFDESKNELLKGVSRIRSLEILLGEHNDRFSEAEKTAMATEKNGYYLEMVETLTPADVLPGALPFLKALREAGVHTAVCSASRNAQRILTLLEIGIFLDKVVDGNDVKNPKPDPEVFLLAAKALGCPAANCLVVEDAGAGVEAGLAAGMKVLGIGSPEHLGNAHLIIPDTTLLSLGTVKKLFA
jgi:beta-phosphoglucomutase